MVKSDGAKFGKSVGGAVWLDPARTSPYQFRQFWMQTDDQMVGTYLKMLSLRPLDEIEALLAEHDGAPERRLAQRALADELTTMVHGRCGRSRRRAGRRGAVRWRPDRRVGRRAGRGRRARRPSVALPDDLDDLRVHELLIAGRRGQVEQRGHPTARPGRRARRKSCARQRRPAARIGPAQRRFPAAPQGQARLRRRKTLPRG